MKCHKCGYMLPDDSEFCQYCGVKLEDVFINEQNTEVTANTVCEEKSENNNDITFCEDSDIEIDKNVLKKEDEMQRQAPNKADDAGIYRKNKWCTFAKWTAIILSVISCISIIIAMNFQDAKRNRYEDISPDIIYSILIGLHILYLLILIMLRKKGHNHFKICFSLFPAIASIAAIVEGSVFSSKWKNLVNYNYINSDAVAICNYIWVFASFAIALVIFPFIVINIKKSYHSSIRYREKCYKRIARLHKYLDDGIINQDEYERTKKDILKNVIEK